MKNLTHPNFILGATSLLLLIIAVILKANGFGVSNYLILAVVIIGAIHWIWSIIDVLKNMPAGSQSRVFWLILVAIIPPLGGIIYYLTGRDQMQM